ncbi:MAG: FtsX-like permease family protein, partial [Psittacicella sp.]
ASSNLLTPSLKNKFQISSPISRNYQFLGAISTEKHIMLIMISFIILISCINIIVSLSISIFSKKKEVAILRTLGLTKFRISLIFMLQILILTIFSLVLSNIISFIIIDKTNLLNNILDIPGDFILKLNYGSIILVDISTILITFLAALYPSIKANQINIIKNL